MTEMINRVNDAILKKLDAENPCGISSETWDSTMREIIGEVMSRAAIEAMREPTYNMKISGAKAPPSGTLTNTMDGKAHIVTLAWQAMIDEALDD
jgi:hypothetical protein